ncbi:hypothetical protein GCM10020229_25910 [Kitasatospora albolonga]
MRRELDREPQRGLVPERFVSSLPAEDEDVLRRMLTADAAAPSTTSM